MKTINAGLLSTIKTLLSSLSKFIQDSLQGLADAGYGLSDVKKTNNGGVKFRVETNNHDKADVEYKPVSGKEDTFDIIVKNCDAGNTETLKNVKGSDRDDKLLGLLKDWFGENTEIAEKSDVNSNKRLEVTLQKVTSSTDITVNLTAINANYDAQLALSDLNSVLTSDEFVEAITDQPQSFLITQDDTDFDVCPIEGVSICDACNSVIKEAYRLLITLQLLHWNVKGAGSVHIHYMLNDHISSVNSAIDTFAEVCVANCGCVQHPVCNLSAECDMISATTFTTVEAAEIARTAINSYVATLECYVVNFERDMQSEIDSMLRYWKHQSDYFLKNMVS